MRSISIKAVLIGTVFGLFLDLLTGVALTFTLGHSALSSETTSADAGAVLESIARQPGFLVWSLVLGALTTVIAGYLAARIARRLPYMNAAAAGVVGLVLGALLADGSLPLWFNVPAFALLLPCALLGGHLAKRRQQAEA
jgi:MFS family permease